MLNLGMMNRSTGELLCVGTSAACHQVYGACLHALYFPSSSDTLPEELLCRTIQANSHEQVSRLSLSQQAGRQAGKEVPVKGHGEWTSRFDALAAIFACGIKKAPPGLKAGVGLKESVAPAAANKSTALKFV